MPDSVEQGEPKAGGGERELGKLTRDPWERARVSVEYNAWLIANGRWRGRLTGHRI